MDLPPPPSPDQMSSDQSSSFNSLFSSKAAPSTGANPDVINQINSLGRRVRMMEESVTNIRRKIEIQEEDSIKSSKSVNTNIQTLFGELDDMKHTLKSFKDDMMKVIRELQGTVKREEVTALKKYVELWQPIKFVTQNEVERIVNHLIEMKLSNKRVVEDLIDSKIDEGTIKSTRNVEFEEPPSPQLIETIREKVNLKKQEEEAEEESQPKSILHAMASNIEREKKTSAILQKAAQERSAPNKMEEPVELPPTLKSQPTLTRLQETEQPQQNSEKSISSDPLNAKIEAIMRRKKELHDLLGR